MISEKGLELLDALEESLREDDAWHSEGGYFEAKDELLDYIATLERQLSDMKEGLSPDEVMDELTPYVEGYSGFTLSKERYWGQYISPYGGAPEYRMVWYNFTAEAWESDLIETGIDVQRLWKLPGLSYGE